MSEVISAARRPMFFRKLLNSVMWLLSVAGVALAKALLGEPEPDFTGDTVLGALALHVTTPTGDFQPMNANFGILRPLDERVRGKRSRYEKLAGRSLETLKTVITNYAL